MTAYFLLLLLRQIVHMVWICVPSTYFLLASNIFMFCILCCSCCLVSVILICVSVWKWISFAFVPNSVFFFFCIYLAYFMGYTCIKALGTRMKRIIAKTTRTFISMHCFYVYSVIRDLKPEMGNNFSERAVWSIMKSLVAINTITVAAIIYLFHF